MSFEQSLHLWERILELGRMYKVLTAASCDVHRGPVKLVFYKRNVLEKERERVSWICEVISKVWSRIYDVTRTPVH